MCCCSFRFTPFSIIETRVLRLAGTEVSWHSWRNVPEKENPLWEKMSCRTIFAARASVRASSEKSLSFRVSLRRAAIPFWNTMTLCRPSLCSLASGNASKSLFFSLNRLIELVFPKSFKRFSYILCSSDMTKKWVSFETASVIYSLSSTKALDSLTFSSSNASQQASFLFFRSTDLSLFLSVVRHRMWYFASMAIRSPPDTRESKSKSFNTVAIRRMFLSASNVVNLCRVSPSLSQIMHFSSADGLAVLRALGHLIAPKGRFCGVSLLARLLLSSAFFSLDDLNFKWQDRCHLARFAIIVSTVVFSRSKLISTGRQSRFLNARTLSRKDL